MSRDYTRPSTLKPGGSAALAALLLVLTTLLPVRASLAVAQRTEAIVLIVASTSELTDIPSDVVRSAFLGLRVEYRGVALIPFNLPPRDPTRERLDRVLLGLEQNEVGKFWVDQRIRDSRTAPRTLPSAELLVRVVAQLRGGIGAVPLSAVGPKTRALRIDGRGPNDSGYLLANK